MSRLTAGLLFLLLAAVGIVRAQRTSGPSADPSELSCTATTFPCLRTRYIALVLDFARLEDFALSLPTSSPWEAPRSAYRDALDVDQGQLPFVRSLCFSSVATFSQTTATSTTSADTAGSTEAQDAAMIGEVRSFSEYQAYFASQYEVPVSVAAYPTPAPSTTTAAPPAATLAPSSIASTTATASAAASTSTVASTTSEIMTTTPPPTSTTTQALSGDSPPSGGWRRNAALNVDVDHLSPLYPTTFLQRRREDSPLADSTSIAPATTTAPLASSVTNVPQSTTATPTMTTTASPGGTTTPTTAAPPTTTVTPASIVVGDPVKQPICTAVTLATTLHGTTSSFPANATTTDVANGVVTSAALVATPGVRLLPFRSAGGHVVIPYGGSPATVDLGGKPHQHQYLATLAVTTTGARAKSLFSVLQSFAVRPPSSVDAASTAPGAAATNDNYLYTQCGLYDVAWLTTTAYESLYLTQDAGARVGLFAAVGFGQAASEGLTLPWILLLIVGTCLAALVIYAFCVRRQADANQKDAAGEGSAGVDDANNDGDNNDDDIDEDYEEELKATEAEQLIQQNIRTVWQERDLTSELRSAVLAKIKAEGDHAEAEQMRLTGGRGGGGGGNRSPTATSDNGSNGSDDAAASRKDIAATHKTNNNNNNAVVTRVAPDGTTLVVLQPLHDSHVGSTQHIAPRRAGGKANVARTQLLPNSSYFEETLELSAEYNLPPDAHIMKDEVALANYLRVKREARRRRDEDLGVGLNPGGTIRLPGGADAGGGAGGGRNGSSSGSNGQSPTSDGYDNFGDIMSLPPAAVEIPQSELDEAGRRRAASEDAAQDFGGGGANSPHGGQQPKPIGLAARRMANMMSNIRFAAVPSGVLRLPSRHEMIGQLSGGSATSHMAMAGAADDVTDRLMRQRFSKLYFAPQALVDQPADDSDDSAPSSPSPSPRARRAVPELRFQDITKNLNASSSGHHDPQLDTYSPRSVSAGGSSSPAASSPPRSTPAPHLPVRESNETSHDPGQSPTFRVEL